MERSISIARKDALVALKKAYPGISGKRALHALRWNGMAIRNEAFWHLWRLIAKELKEGRRGSCERR